AVHPLAVDEVARLGRHAQLDRWTARRPGAADVERPAEVAAVVPLAFEVEGLRGGLLDGVVAVEPGDLRGADVHRLPLRAGTGVRRRVAALARGRQHVVRT